MEKVQGRSGVLFAVLSSQDCTQRIKSIPISQDSGNAANTGNTGSAIPSASPASMDPLTLVSPSDITVDMNVGGRIVASVSQYQPNLQYVIVTRPKSGTVTVGTVPVVSSSNTSTVTYFPGRDFIGTDSFELAVALMQNGQAFRTGPTQMFTIHVSQAGIGQMLGTFQKQTCIPNVSTSTGIYTSTLTQYTFQQTVYDKNCTAAQYTVSIGGLHTTGLENVPTPSGLTAFEYNVSNESFFITPLSATVAQSMNNSNFCGLNNWVANSRRDLSIIGCNGMWRGPNVYLYRRVEFPGGQPPKMYLSIFGVGGDGNTPATRTTSLDLNGPYLKTAN